RLNRVRNFFSGPVRTRRFLAAIRCGPSLCGSQGAAVSARFHRTNADTPAAPPLTSPKPFGPPRSGGPRNSSPGGDDTGPGGRLGGDLKRKGGRGQVRPEGITRWHVPGAEGQPAVGFVVVADVLLEHGRQIHPALLPRVTGRKERGLDGKHVGAGRPP